MSGISPIRIIIEYQFLFVRLLAALFNRVAKFSELEVLKMKVKVCELTAEKINSLFFRALLSFVAFATMTAAPSLAQNKTNELRPIMKRAVKFDVSPPLRKIKPVLSPWDEDKGEDDRGATGPIGDTIYEPDPVVQKSEGRGVFNQDSLIPPTGVSFNGIFNTSTVGGPIPPDPVGDIGLNHYVQMVNSRFQIFSRAGASLYGPANINTIFSGFGGACQNENAGDPIVLYDQLADRWLLSQFTAAGPIYFNCVALSTSGDPTGTYYRYAFTTGANFPDYPKYGVWSNAYFISTREFNSTDNFVGVGAYALNRAQMIAGNPSPQVISFLVPPGVAPYRVGDGLLPADLDGNALPPAGSPGYFIGTMDSGFGYGAPTDALNLFKFTVYWDPPLISSFSFFAQLNTAAFDSIFPCSGGATPARNCISQPGTATKIDILSSRQRPTFRLSYRNLGTHESLVTSQSVEASAGVAGMRWYEIRSPNSSPTIFQQGTYSPDSVNRWMGSIATDRQGNMGMAYSVSDGTSVFPGIRYTGRLVTDVLGSMPQGEGTMIAGSGSQTDGASRWGDYSSINLDPTDDCTFWYTNQYYAATSARGWRTRIGSFKFPDCNVYNIAGTVNLAITPSKLIPNVSLSAANALPLSAVSNASGAYAIGDMTAGNNYVVTPSKNGQANGITSFDATLVLRCVAAAGSCALSTDQRSAADSNNSGTLSAFDATQILRYVAAGGATSGSGSVGQWKFTPALRSYSPISSSQSSQNYGAILIGDVNGSWS